MIERLIKIKEKLAYSTEIEGEEYKWMGLRNNDIDFLIKTIEKQQEEIEDLKKK